MVIRVTIGGVGESCLESLVFVDFRAGLTTSGSDAQARVAGRGGIGFVSADKAGGDW